MKIYHRLWSVIMVACIAAPFLFGTVDAGNVLLAGATEKAYPGPADQADDSGTYLVMAELSLSSGLVKPATSDNPLSQEKTLKHKLLHQQNLLIERSVVGYIIQTHSLTHYKQTHIELRRLNI